MNNLNKTLLIILTLCSNLYILNAQQVVDEILDVPEEGIRFIVYDSMSSSYIDTSSIQCHPDDGHPIYLRLRASVNADSNNVIITQSGMLGIGLEDPCSDYDVKINPYELADVKLFLKTGSAVKNDGSAEWGIPSDIRLKKNVEDFTDGMNVIAQINPISYTYNGKAGTMDGQNAIGISAQEMVEIAPYTVNTIKAPIDTKSNSKEEVYIFNGSALRYVIINALKELSMENEALENELAMQKSELNDLKNEVAELKNLVNLLVQSEGTQHNKINHSYQASSPAYLGQNQPNPFANSSVIQYQLPKDAQTASMVFYDANGKMVYQVNLSNQSGEVKFNPLELGLQKGIYFYSLLANGESIATRKMSFI